MLHFQFVQGNIPVMTSIRKVRLCVTHAANKRVRAARGVPPEQPQAVRVHVCPLPHLECQHWRLHRVQGEILSPGARVEAVERFTPANDDSGVVFIKLPDGRGWVPIRDGDVH